MIRRADVAKKALFFFCCAVFAFCTALYLHEWGHALLIKIIHGYFPKMTMNPLSGGYVSYYAAPATEAERLWISGGGILVGMIGGGAAAAGGLFFGRSVWAAPVILFGIVSVCVNALMLTAGYFLFATGDIHRMVDAGFPVALATVLGLLGLLAGGYIMVRALPYFGLDRHAPMTEKYIVLGGGVVLYGAFVLVSSAWANDTYDLMKKIKYVTATLTVLAVGLWMVDRSAGRLAGTRDTRYIVHGRHLAFSGLLAAAAFYLVGR